MFERKKKDSKESQINNQMLNPVVTFTTAHWPGTSQPWATQIRNIW